MGLAAEGNLGDGITRYDRVTRKPHGHLYCLGCKQLIEFEVGELVGFLENAADDHDFSAEGFKVEVQGYCPECRAKREQSISNETDAIGGEQSIGSKQ